MFKQLVCFLYVVVCAVSFVGSTYAESIDESTDLNTRASAAIAQAIADGNDVSISASDLVGAIEGVNNASFTYSNSVTFSSQSSRRYKCSATKWYAGNGLTINWWADTTNQGGLIVRIDSTGWNYQWSTWIPTLDAVVSASSSASILHGGRKIRLRLDGTVKYWLAGLPISTKALNVSCTRNA